LFASVDKAVVAGDKVVLFLFYLFQINHKYRGDEGLFLNFEEKKNILKE